jgi:hypothetical protein
MAKYKKKINEKAFKSLLHDIDPKNIAKILTGKETGGDIVGKIIGKNSEEKIFAGKIVNDTATKLNPIDEEPGLTDMLAKIYGLMKTANDRRIKQKQLENNYKEEIATEKALRHKELLDAIKKAKGTTTTITNMAEPIKSGSFLDDIIDFLLNYKLLAALAKRIPIVAAILGLVKAKEFLDEIDYGGSMNKNEAKIGQKAFREKVTDFSKFPLKQDEAKAILEQDDGPAKKRDIASFGGIERITAIAEGKPDPGGIIPTQKTYEEHRQEVLPQKVAPRPEGAGSKGKLKQEQWDKTYSKDYNPDGTRKTATPVAAEETRPTEESSPTKKNMDIPAEENKFPESVPEKSNQIPVSQNTAVNEETPNQSVRLNSVINENQTNKIMADINSGEDVNVVNNQIVNSNSQKTSMSKSALPSVRNLESTYERMIYDSTRIV